MSDQSPITPYDSSYYTERGLIQSIISDYFFVDYGIVQSVNNNSTVNVVHATRDVLINDIVLPEIISNDVEILFPSSSAFGINWTVKQGDGVLLLGLRNVIPTTNGLSVSQIPQEFFHYSQENLKAIPLSFFGTPTSSIVESNGSLNIKAGQKITLTTVTGSLFSFVVDLSNELNNTITQVSGMVTALAALVPGGSAAIAPFLTQLVTIQGQIAVTKANIQGGSN